MRSHHRIPDPVEAGADTVSRILIDLDQQGAKIALPHLAHVADAERRGLPVAIPAADRVPLLGEALDDGLGIDALRRIEAAHRDRPGVLRGSVRALRGPRPTPPSLRYSRSWRSQRASMPSPRMRSSCTSSA